MHAARNLGLIVLCLASASCSKFGKGDADAAAEAGPDAAADADVDAGAADAAADAADAAAPTLTPTTTAAAHGTGGPFAGTYHCFGGLTLTQNGNLVSGVTTNKLSTAVQTIQWNCSVTRPNHCEGTQVTTLRANDPKTPPKAPDSRHLTIDHNSDSSVSIHLERSVETTNCKK